MSARQCYEAILIELNKENAPNILLEDFNYLFNKAINQYINKRYNIYDINQQTTDDLRVLKATSILPVHKAEMYDDSVMGRMMGATYEVNLPMDYLHLLNCICIYNVNKTFKCYNKGDIWRRPATRLTSDIYSQVLDNFWMRPTYRRPYYYIHNVNYIGGYGDNPEDDKLENGKYVNNSFEKGKWTTDVTTNPYDSDSRRGTDYSFPKKELNDPINDDSTVLFVQNHNSVKNARRNLSKLMENLNKAKILHTGITASIVNGKVQNLVETVTKNTNGVIEDNKFEEIDVKTIEEGVFYNIITNSEIVTDNNKPVEKIDTYEIYQPIINSDNTITTNIVQELEVVTPYINDTLNESASVVNILSNSLVADTSRGTDGFGSNIINGEATPLFNTVKIDGNETSNVERAAKVRYGNASKVRLELRYGTDDSLFKLTHVYIDYIKAPQNIRLTQEQLDLTEDTSQMLEFPDYVCQEIINELTHIVMENISEQRLQTHPVVSQSIANPAQAQAPEAAGQSA